MRTRFFGLLLSAGLCLPVTVVTAQTRTNAAPPLDPVRAEAMRATCLQGRRLVCGRILAVEPVGMIVECGYSDLLREPLNKSWLVPGTATVARNPSLVEADRPDALVTGTILLTDYPKSRTLKPKVYDYVNLHAYPAGEYFQTLPGGLKKPLRRFAGGIETAVRLQLTPPEPTSVPATKAGP